MSAQHSTNGLTALILVFVLTATAAFAQSGDALIKLKAAAEAGDPAAQTKMADRDHSQADMWLRKASAQGYAPAQGKLGNLLLLRARTTLAIKPEQKAAKEAMANEALKWASLAANQGDSQGQANLADIYWEGKLVSQDLIAAYQWGELASRADGVLNFAQLQGKSIRDQAILKMTAGQIEEAKRRVAAFTPGAPVKKSEVPVPAWTREIKLTGISGGPAKRFATIGKNTFEPGESGTVKVGGKTVTIKCLEITDTTATIAVEGIESPQTLTLD